MLEEFVADPNDSHDREDIDGWLTSAKAFLSALAMDIPPPSKKKRWHRLSSLWHVRALDHALVGATGQGLAKFVVLPGQVLGCRPGCGPQDVELPPPPCIGIASDSCNVMLSWVYYTYFQTPLNFAHFQDPAHAANAVVLNAIKVAGIWETVLLNRIVFRVNFGPFASQAWRRQMVDAATRFRKHGNSDDPIFQFYLRDILEDIGHPDKLQDELFIEQTFESLFSPEFAHEVGPHIQFSRWGSIIDVGRWYDKRGHKRLVLLLYIGLHQKWINKGDDNYLKGVVMKADRSESSDTKSTTNKKYHSAGESLLRNRCQNLLHMATLVMMEKQEQRKQRVIEYFAEPMRKWLGVQVALNRNGPAVRDFSVREAPGAWILVCNDTIDIIYDGQKLQRLGIKVELEPYHKSMSADHPEVIEQNELTSSMVLFALQLMRSRVRQALRWTNSLPLRFAAFLSPEESVRNEALLYSRDAWRAWLAASKVEVGLAQKVSNRSFCNWTAVQIMCNYGERVAWQEVTPHDGAARSQHVRPGHGAIQGGRGLGATRSGFRVGIAIGVLQGDLCMVLRSARRLAPRGAPVGRGELHRRVGVRTREEAGPRRCVPTEGEGHDGHGVLRWLLEERAPDMSDLPIGFGGAIVCGLHHAHQVCRSRRLVLSQGCVVELFVGRRDGVFAGRSRRLVLQLGQLGEGHGLRLAHGGDDDQWARVLRHAQEHQACRPLPRRGARRVQVGLLQE